MENQNANAISRKEFDVLVSLVDANENLTQRELADRTGHSVGTISKVYNILKEKEFVNASGVTEKGLSALEPYRVKRAIIIAAGFGSRLVPITLNTPKPLVRVNGVRIIDTTLDALVAAGIEEIIIVRGYLYEQFDQLLYKYPMVKFVENLSYNEANNISSIMRVRDKLKNAYVLEADLLLHNPKLIRKYEYESNCLGIPVERTDDWCFHVKNETITLQKIGGELSEAAKEPGTTLYQMVGISYWTEEAGARLENDMKTVFEMPGGKEKYWDQVPMTVYCDDYKVKIRKCKFEDIVEIDTFRELTQIDKSYCVK